MSLFGRVRRGDKKIRFSISKVGNRNRFRKIERAKQIPVQKQLGVHKLDPRQHLIRQH